MLASQHAKLHTQNIGPLLLSIFLQKSPFGSSLAPPPLCRFSEYGRTRSFPSFLNLPRKNRDRGGLVGKPTTTYPVVRGLLFVVFPGETYRLFIILFVIDMQTYSGFNDVVSKTPR